MKQLRELAQSVAEASTFEALVRPILDLLQRISGLESTYFTRVDQPADMQEIVYVRNAGNIVLPEGLQVPWCDTLCKRALVESRSFTNEVDQHWGDSAAAAALGLKTYVSVPVRTADGALYGTLCGASGESVTLAPGTEDILTLCAALIARQLDVQRLSHVNDALTVHAMRDPLTGLANRRYLVETLTGMLARAARNDTAVHVAFIDLDDFKQLNDEHGHDMGDHFLLELSRRLDHGARSGDLVARWGGDEFVVLAPDGHAADAEAERARIRERLGQELSGEFVLPGLLLTYGGPSIGVVTSEPGEDDPDALLVRADRAMYTVKKARRTARA